MESLMVVNATVLAWINGSLLLNWIRRGARCLLSSLRKVISMCLVGMRVLAELTRSSSMISRMTRGVLWAWSSRCRWRLNQALWSVATRWWSWVVTITAQGRKTQWSWIWKIFHLSNWHRCPIADSCTAPSTTTTQSMCLAVRTTAHARKWAWVTSSGIHVPLTKNLLTTICRPSHMLACELP